MKPLDNRFGSIYPVVKTAPVESVVVELVPSKSICQFKVILLLPLRIYTGETTMRKNEHAHIIRRCNRVLRRHRIIGTNAKAPVNAWHLPRMPVGFALQMLSEKGPWFAGLIVASLFWREKPSGATAMFVLPWLLDNKRRRWGRKTSGLHLNKITIAQQMENRSTSLMNSVVFYINSDFVICGRGETAQFVDLFACETPFRLTGQSQSIRHWLIFRLVGDSWDVAYIDTR